MRVLIPRAFRSQQISRTKLHARREQHGYILLTLLLAVAVVTIAMVAALQIGQQLRRDREEELCHRGTAYMRAIQTFHRKLGRYPVGIEELQNSNNMRFIRKLYKDPMTRDRATGREKDFKVLREMDISLRNGPVVGQTPGQNGLPGQDDPKGQGGLGSSGAAPSGLQPTDGPQSPPNGSDAGADSNSPGSSSVDSKSVDSKSDSGSDEQTFGGGDILGVVSTSKKESIREFYGKNHYDDWLFVYLQQNDFRVQLKGPANLGVPTPAAGALGGMAPGLPGQGQGITGQTSTPQTQPAPNSVAPSPN
jgi:type II secretory pathway pseudopilin PulG